MALEDHLKILVQNYLRESMENRHHSLSSHSSQSHLSLSVDQIKCPFPPAKAEVLL